MQIALNVCFKVVTLGLFASILLTSCAPELVWG